MFSLCLFATLSSFEEENLAKHVAECESSHLMLKYPAQCVVKAEAVAWTRDVNRALESDDAAKLLLLR